MTFSDVPLGRWLSADTVLIACHRLGSAVLHVAFMLVSEMKAQGSSFLLMARAHRASTSQALTAIRATGGEPGSIGNTQPLRTPAQGEH